MTLHDIYLLSPELSLTGLALIIVVLDVFIKNRVLIQSTIALGLLVPVILSVLLWNGIGISEELNSNNQAFGIFDTLVVDKFTLLFKFVFLGILSIVMISSVSYVHRFEKTKIEYFSLLIFATVGMIFVPSVAGVSHAPDEHTIPQDSVNGANVLLQTLLELDER